MCFLTLFFATTKNDLCVRLLSDEDWTFCKTVFAMVQRFRDLFLFFYDIVTHILAVNCVIRWIFRREKLKYLYVGQRSNTSRYCIVFRGKDKHEQCSFMLYSLRLIAFTISLAFATTIGIDMVARRSTKSSQIFERVCRIASITRRPRLDKLEGNKMNLKRVWGEKNEMRRSRGVGGNTADEYNETIDAD